jgi:hypothetical protein
MLWRDSLVMFDRATRSLWSQLLGRAVAGPLTGRSLEVIPSEVTTWRAWRERHPGTRVLEKGPAAMVDIERRGSSYDRYHQDEEKIGVLGTENPDPRLPGKTLVFGMQRRGASAAVPFSLLEEHPVLNTELFGTPVVIFSPRAENAAMAFVRLLPEGAVLTFEEAPAEGSARLSVQDSASLSVWSWQSGQCVQGPFEGKSLERITGIPVYWGVWAQFHPGSEIVEAP